MSSFLSRIVAVSIQISIGPAICASNRESMKYYLTEQVKNDFSLSKDSGIHALDHVLESFVDVIALDFHGGGDCTVFLVEFLGQDREFADIFHPGNLVRPHVQDVARPQADHTGVGAIDAAGAVEKGGLAVQAGNLSSRRLI